MADVTKLEQALPAAPLKIVALDSAAEMGRVINEYLVNFRKETHKDLTNDPAFQGYHEDNFLADSLCPRESCLHDIPEKRDRLCQRWRRAGCV